jgi:hypothetical protein
MYDHSKRVYMKMLEEAKMEEVAGESGEPMVLWTGHLTHLIKDKLNYSTPYYSSITQNLKRMGCIKQIRRGGGNAPSVWELLKEPSEDLFKNAEELRKPGNTSQDMFMQNMRDLNARLVQVEATVRALVDGKAEA